MHEFLNHKQREQTDYLIETLKDKQKQEEIFLQMLNQLEYDGSCRYVYHRLAFVLFGKNFEELE
jgi:hypothetical protein